MMSGGFRLIASAVACALALCVVPGASVGAQRPARPTGPVTITSKPSMEPLRPPRRSTARTPMMARTVSTVENWFDRTSAPQAPPNPAVSRDVSIIARELTLENIAYTLDAPRLVIVADNLRIGANAVIDSSGRSPRQAGRDVVLIARRLTCESGGTLNVLAKGGPLGARGGSVIVVAENVEMLDRVPDARQLGPRKRVFGLASPVAVRPGREGAGAPFANGPLPPCIRASADGGPGGTVEQRDHRQRDPQGRPTVTVQTYPPGARGQVTASTLQDAVQRDPVVRTAWSEWAIEWLDVIRLEIYSASKDHDYPRVLKLLRDYEAFKPPTGLITEDDLQQRYQEILSDLNAYRGKALPALSVEDLTVRPGGLPQNVTVFTEGATLRASLAPTHALASRASIGGRSVLGMIEYRPERPDELTFEVEWQLTVDPWSERLAADQLTKAGQRLDGVFSGWALEAKPMRELGVRSADATLLASGRRLRVRFVVDADRANLVFWRLLNSAGLPWTVGWSFHEQETGRVVNGTWAGPALSLARQFQPSVSLAEGSISNAGSSPVTINYLRNKDGSFSVLSPTLRVKPGETVELPAAVRSGGPSDIPAEAIETAFDPERFGSDFYVVNGDQVVDRVIVRNNLPATDSLRGVFDRLEIKVTASVDGDTTLAPVAAGPFVLSATGTRGGEISIPFLRLSRGTRRLTIEGTAYYADGSVRTLKPTTFDTLAISITREMFVE